MSIKSSTFFSSWSGGKDSALAFYYAVKEGGLPRVLFTMFTEKGERSRSHGLSLEILKEQSRSLGIPLVTQNASWNNYESQFIITLKELKAKGIEYGVFGDIDIEDHLKWVQRVCSYADLKPYHPLWQKSRRDSLIEMLNEGFKATIIAVKDTLLSRDFLGQTLDFKLIQELEAAGIDVCGEEGEFHTVVTDGPIFSYPIQLELKDQVFSTGYWFQDVAVAKRSEVNLQINYNI